MAFWLGCQAERFTLAQPVVRLSPRGPSEVSLSQLFPQTLDLRQQEVDVAKRCRRVRYNHTEEVGFVFEGLVTNHGAAFLHHHGFDLRGHLENSQTLVLNAHRRTHFNQQAFVSMTCVITNYWCLFQ